MYPSTEKLERQTCYLGLSTIFALLHTADSRSNALPRYAANTSQLWGCPSTTGLAKLLSLLSVNEDNYIPFFSLHPATLYFSILKFCCTQIVYFTRRQAPWHMPK